MNQERTKTDIDFLKEIREKIQTGFDKKDPTLIEYGLKMIDDWIDELTEQLAQH